MPRVIEPSQTTDESGDLFAPPPTSPRGRRVLTVSSFLFAAAAPWVPLLGVLGMITGSLAHLKGDRYGMVGAVLSGITTIVGMAVIFLLRT